MAGRPKARAQRLELASQADATTKRIARIRAALAADGLDPNRYDTEGPRHVQALEAYAPALPQQMVRMASEGLSIEEIRAELGFTEGQEREWAEQYVDFSQALSRVHARERAYWHAQARIAAQAGDRAGWQAATTLISKRFEGPERAGNAQELVHVHIGKPLEQRVDDES